MERQGMVHALEEIHRLLNPTGLLIDLHPVPESTLIRVYDRGEILFEEPLADTGDEDVIQAERALAQVADRGLFVPDASHEFDVHIYASSVGELLDCLELLNAFDTGRGDEAAALHDQEVAAQARKTLRKSGEGARVAYYERGKITRMRPL